MRILSAGLLAVVVAAGLFWLMHYLILGGEHKAGDNESFRTVDFVRLHQEENLQTRERSKPKPPPPEKAPPPPPDLTVQQQQARTQNPTQFNMPKLNVPTSVTGGPFIGELGQGSLVGDGELIPLVRLKPQYPRRAARAGISGWVKLRITVRADGSVKKAQVVEAEPRGLFEASAVTAAMRGRFRPRTVEGEATESSGEYTVRFKLGGDS